MSAATKKKPRERFKSKLRRIARSNVRESCIKRKLEKDFGGDVTVEVYIVPRKSRSPEAIYLHEKLGGIFNKNGDLVKISIEGLGRGTLEF